MDQSRKRGNRDTANSTTTRRHPDRQTPTQTARDRRRLVVNGWSVHAPQHIRFGTLEVCLQNAPGSLPSRSGLLRPREIGMQGGLTSIQSDSVKQNAIHGINNNCYLLQNYSIIFSK